MYYKKYNIDERFISLVPTVISIWKSCSTLFNGALFKGDGDDLVALLAFGRGDFDAIANLLADEGAA